MIDASDGFERVGRLLFKVNAKDLGSACDAAKHHGGNATFASSEYHAMADGGCAAALGEDPWDGQIAVSDAEGSGAWTIIVRRVGFSQDGQRDQFSEYFAEEARFIGSAPHQMPHAQDDPVYWTAYAKAMIERAAIERANADATVDPGPRLKKRSL